MLTFLKRNLFITLIFFITLSSCFITFLTFIDKSIVQLNEESLQTLLIINVFLLLVFFIMIFIEIKNSFKNNLNVSGSIANRKYIILIFFFIYIFSVFFMFFINNQYYFLK